MSMRSLFLRFARQTYLTVKYIDHNLFCDNVHRKAAKYSHMIFNSFVIKLLSNPRPASFGLTDDEAPHPSRSLIDRSCE